MANFDDKISQLINSQLPDFVVDDHPKFVEFLKLYYAFMESAEMQVTGVQLTDGITLENETGILFNVLLDGSKIGAENTQLDTGDKLLLEESNYGKFQKGETIIGQTSKATSTILAEDLDNDRIFISAQDKFIIGEIILGSLSGASAIVNNYKPNPVHTIQQLTNFRDPDKVISNFLTNFRDEFLKTLPENLSTNVNKRSLIKNIKSLYRLKGTKQGHELFFRILFNEISETIYPREQMLRVSHGNWDTTTVLRTIDVIGDTSKLIGRTIGCFVGTTQTGTAVIETVKKFQTGTNTISEFILNKETIFGTFDIGSEIRGTENDEDDYFIKSIITGIPGNKTVINSGALYTINDIVTVSGGGEGASFQIVQDDIGSGKINEILINTPGQDYQIGDPLVFNNTGTLGSGASGFVSVVNGGFTQEESLSLVDDHIVLEDYTGIGDIYSGNKIVQEGNEVSDANDITDIFITNKGNNYISLPSVTVSSVNGTGATLFSYGENIGRILGIKTNELGSGYENSPSPPILSFYTNLLVLSSSGSFVSGQTITGNTSGATAIVADYNNNTGVLKLKNVVNSFSLDETVTSSLGVTATIAKINVASVSVDVSSIVDTDGAFIDEEGFLDEQTKKIQDSLYYQDFSYVLKVGKSINDWRDSFKKTMHASGFYFTGQVSLENRVNARIRFPITGAVTGSIEEPLFSILNILFSTLVGRRLGTLDDGTNLNVNPNNSIYLDLDDSTTEHFPENTRDVTLRREPISIDYTSRVRRQISNINVVQGFAYAGPKFGTINKYALSAFGSSAQGSAITIQTLNDILIQGTRSSLDGTNALFLMTSSESGRLVKTNFTIPAFVQRINLQGFDETGVSFDNDSYTFDNNLS